MQHMKRDCSWVYKIKIFMTYKNVQKKKRDMQQKADIHPRTKKLLTQCEPQPANEIFLIRQYPQLLLIVTTVSVNCH